MDARLMPPAMALALEASFGSVARWRESFLALCRERGAGAGRVMLGFEAVDGRLANRLLQQDAQASDAMVLLLARDLPAQALRAEHASADIASWLHDVDWDGVHARYQAAVEVVSAPWACSVDDAARDRHVVRVDVRRSEVYAQATTMILGAAWRNPARVDEWAAALDPAREVLVYCVHGHEVSRAVALRLRAAGLTARYLSGGIGAWEAAAQPVQPGNAHPDGAAVPTLDPPAVRGAAP